MGKLIAVSETTVSRSWLSGNLLRPRGPAISARVTSIELFFDLVFAFAITQLSHHLLADLTFDGAGQTVLLLMAIWMIWLHTTWVTNWLDPLRTPVRAMLLVQMLGSLIVSAAIPEAFGPSGLVLAAAIAVIQISRTLFMIAALRNRSPANELNYQRILVWIILSSVLWLVGSLLDGQARLIAWGLAVVADYIAPPLSFYVPGLGRSNPADWDVDGGHIAERCAGFVLIVFGESIVVTGSSLAAHAWTAETLLAFAVAFTSCVTLWWIYFDTGAERGSERISMAAIPGALARSAYSFLHLPIIAGILVAAVGDDLLLAEPSASAEPAILIGGPALYIAGNLLFKSAIATRPPLSHLVGLTLLAALTPFSGGLPMLGLGAIVMIILIVTASWETRSLRKRT